ncbi:MAG TPA: CvpA family protein [Dehalococcoidales bacterium]|nr:CvpA family protein [Dehalococcoidales bacterium]
MNWLDIVIIIILAGGVFTGVKSGIIKLAFMVVGVVVGVVLAGHFSDSLGALLPISSQDTASALAFAIILIVVLIVAGIVAWVAKWAVKTVMLGWVNALGGGILGLFLGFMFCGALLTMWLKYLGAAGAVENSALAHFTLKTFPVVLGLLPSQFDSVRSFFQ